MIKQTRGAWKLFGLALAASAAFLAGSAQASTITWNVPGGAGGTWDITSPNWTGDSTYFTSDGTVNVIFDATGGGGTISISADMLPSSTTVSDSDYTFTDGPIDGGSLTINGPGTLSLHTTPANFSSVVLNGGTLYLEAADYFSQNGASFNMNNVTINSGATLEGERANMVGTLLTMNGGRYWEDNGFSGSWTGPVYLAADSFFGQNGWCMNQTINGEISGPGGFTFSTQYGATLTLPVANSYAGPTVVTGGTLECDDPDALGTNALTMASGGAKVNLNYTGDHVVAALTLGGVSQPAGTYGSSSSPAPAPNQSAYFSGTGTVTVPGTVPALIYSFGLPHNPAYIDQTAKTITWYQPYGTDVTHLAPTYVLNSGTCVPDSASTQDFTSPVTYTVANEFDTNDYVVTVTVLPNDTTLLWNLTDGTWDYFTPNWIGEPDNVSMQFFTGANVVFTNDAGGQIAIAPDVLPGSIIVGGSGTYTFTGGPIDGGTLTYSGPGQLTLNTTANFSSVLVNAGSLSLGTTANDLLGTGAVMVNSPAILNLNGNNNLMNAFTFNGVTVVNGNSFPANLNGPVTLAATTTFDLQTTGNMSIGGNVSGPGGLTKNGTGQGPLVLSAANSYTGPTIVNSGTVECDDPGSLGAGGALTIASGGAQVNLNYAADHFVSALTLGGAVQPAGTYGSSSSSAPPENQNDTYFAGTGTVTLPGSARIAGFAAARQVGVIDQGALTINVSVPSSTDLATLAPTFTLTSGTCDQASGMPPSPTFAAQNPVHYVVVDGTTTNDYAVTVTVTEIRTTVLDLSTVPEGSGDLILSLAQGSLPVGSILKAVSVDGTVTAGDPYTGDMCVLFGDSSASSFALRVGDGGDGGIPDATTVVNWGASGDGVGQRLVATKTVADGIPANFALNNYAVYLTQGGGGSDWGGAYTGTITLTYQAPVSSAPTLTITGITGPDESGNFTITGTASSSATVGLFRSTAVNASLADWTQDGASQTGTSFSFTGTGGGTQAFFTLKVVP